MPEIFYIIILQMKITGKIVAIPINASDKIIFHSVLNTNLKMTYDIFRWVPDAAGNTV